MNKEQAGRVLAALAGRSDAIVFSRDLTEVAWRELPFYRNYRLYRLTNYATMPVFTMSYLGDGTTYLALDGTAKPIYTVNEKDPLMLKQADVLAYLDFFFTSVHGIEGDVNLVRDVRGMPFMGSLSPAQRQSLQDHQRPLSVSFDNALNAYVAEGTLHYGGTLMTSKIIVLPDGKISFRDQSPLLAGVYIPYDLPNASWLEGDLAS